MNFLTRNSRALEIPGLLVEDKPAVTLHAFFQENLEKRGGGYVLPDCITRGGITIRLTLFTDFSDGRWRVEGSVEFSILFIRSVREVKILLDAYKSVEALKRNGPKALDDWKCISLSLIKFQGLKVSHVP